LFIIGDRLVCNAKSVSCVCCDMHVYLHFVCRCLQTNANTSALRAEVQCEPLKKLAVVVVVVVVTVVIALLVKHVCNKPLQLQPSVT
jgi:hypothetical protein